MAASQYYQALVDIGSNGIRFSISDLSPPTARITPTIYQDRSGISLYDAQHSVDGVKALSSNVIEETVAALLRFKRTCEDFGVYDGNIRVVATEATRTAINRDVLLSEIKDKTGWDVRLLTKEEEGTLGAMGIASSVDHLDGLCMDLGGGSIQMTWVSRNSDGSIKMGPSVSFPYGAAALTFELSKVRSHDDQRLETMVASRLRSAVELELQIPSSRWDSTKHGEPLRLYLSGGGFRGWGHILMSRENVQPYPVSTINGYTVSKTNFFSNLDSAPASGTVHRISSRRASQVPAVQVIIKALKIAQLPIAQVTFAQGGVREGLLFSDLPPSVQAQSPLVAATRPMAPRSAARLISLLQDAMPYHVEPELLEAVVNLLYVHGPLPKDVRAAAALRCTTHGLLAGAHGLSHRHRQLIALILCERWGGDLSDDDAGFRDRLQTLQKDWSWWTKYIGRAAKGIAQLFPGGVVRDDEQTITVEAGFPSGVNLELADSCWINLTLHRRDVRHTAMAWAADMEKLGKKKNWANDSRGLKVDVEVKLDANIAEEC